MKCAACARAPLATLCILLYLTLGCSTPESRPEPAPSPPPARSPEVLAQPAQPAVDPAFKADLVFFCEALSEDLMATPEDEFTQAVFAHWTATIQSPDVLTLIDAVTHPATADPLVPLNEALTRAGLEQCPVKAQLFEDTPNVAPPRVATSDAEMRDALRAVVQSNLSDLQACYREELRVTPSFDARFKLGITIDDRGTVSELSVQYNENVSPRAEFTSCLYNEVLTWTFPIPPSPPLKVIYPLNFKS